MCAGSLQVPEGPLESFERSDKARFPQRNLAFLRFGAVGRWQWE